MNNSLILSDVKTENLTTMSTKELANFLKTSPKVILENAKKCLPNKKIENGKPTYWDKAEVTVLIYFMQNNKTTMFNSQASQAFTDGLRSISTDLTPALKLKKALDLAQEAYEEELQIIRARAELAESVVNRIADGKGCYTINQTAKALKLPYGNIKLFEKLRAMQILNLDNSPKQEQINNGNFKVVVKFINEKIGNKPVTLTTSKGLVYLAKKLNTEIDESVLPDYE